jgi:hypothetical protein
MEEIDLSSLENLGERIAWNGYHSNTRLVNAPDFLDKYFLLEPDPDSFSWRMGFVEKKLLNPIEIDTEKEFRIYFKCLNHEGEIVKEAISTFIPNKELSRQRYTVTELTKEEWIIEGIQ